MISMNQVCACYLMNSTEYEKKATRVFLKDELVTQMLLWYSFHLPLLILIALLIKLPLMNSGEGGSLSIFLFYCVSTASVISILQFIWIGLRRLHVSSFSRTNGENVKVQSLGNDMVLSLDDKTWLFSNHLGQSELA